MKTRSLLDLISNVCCLLAILPLLLAPASSSAETRTGSSLAQRDAAFADGLKAFDAGDYAIVLTHWQPLAVGGYLAAQLALADMFDRGLLGQVRPQKGFIGIARRPHRAHPWLL